MLVISTREFREKQGVYLGMAKNGEDIILKSRENGSFKLTPVSESDMIVEKDYYLKPDADLARAITGEQLLERLIPRIEKLFDR
jgi:hypothetical protein